MSKQPKIEPKRILSWTDEGWDDYLFWQTNDQDKAQKINDLIKDIRRQPFQGLGKPESLKHDLAGYWSRRINGEHRLVYAIDATSITIIACKYHYK